MFRQPFAADALSLFELAGLEVAGGQSADDVDDVHDGGRAELGQGLRGEGVGLDQFPGLVQHEAKQVTILGHVFLAACHRDRLEILTAHHRARPAARQRACAVVHDGRDAAEVLAGRADTQDVPAIIVLPQRGGGFGDGLAPQVGGVFNLHPVRSDLNLRGLGGSAANDQYVVAGALELHAPPAAAVGVQHGARQRAFGAHSETVARLRAAGGEGAGGEDERVVLGERFDLRADQVPQ